MEAVRTIQVQPDDALLEQSRVLEGVQGCAHVPYGFSVIEVII